MRGDAFTIWATISIIIFPVLVIWLVTPEKTIAQFIPTCRHSVSTGHQGCPACGLTRAFYAIKRADYDAAKEFNHGSIPLFLMICGNTFVFATIVTLKRQKIIQ